MKKIICLLLSVLFISAFTLSGCGDSDINPTDAPEATTTVAAVTIDEAAAKEIVWNDMCIQESAVENLTVKFENNSYIIAFEWSGFDYQYTINAGTGEIAEVLFDGSVL